MNKLTRIVFSFIALCFLTCSLSSRPAISQESANNEVPLNQYGIRSINPYVVDRFIKDGKTIDKVMVPSSPPSAAFKAQAALVPEPDMAAGINVIAGVPALSWVFGCSATSAAMMFGYYDNIGYSDMYTGPTNGGVFPMTNEAWGYADIKGESRALCPLSATRLGDDGRTIKGHVDDYWVKIYSSLPDPYITGSWTEHRQGDCTADYMGTNQHKHENPDGSTTFWYYTDGSPTIDFTYYEPSSRDGCHGMRLFAESRGYKVETNFSQYIYGYASQSQGFTFNDFKNEIDAGRPVLIQVEGHTMLGYGYNDAGSTVYIHNTWDHYSHTMTWGGYYDNMKHYGVTVLHLAPVASTAPTVSTTPPTSITSNSAVSGGNISSSGNSPVMVSGVCWSTYPNPTTNDTCTSDGAISGSFTSYLRGLNPGTPYHVRAYAKNSTGTAYGSDLSFTTASADPPTVTTTAVISITTNSAVTGGNITSSGSFPVTASGVCWSTSPNPTINDNCTSDGTGTGSFTSTINGLNPKTVYHVRAYATNSAGTAYGSDLSFTTKRIIFMPWILLLLDEDDTLPNDFPDPQ